MRIAIGSDHKGYRLKEQLKGWLSELGFEVLDMGTSSEERVDYPDFGVAVGRAVASGEADSGVVICASGIGMSVTVNKIPGIRGALCRNTYDARMARSHNNGNVLCLGAQVVTPDDAKEIMQVWLTEPYEGGCHQRRLDKIRALEIAPSEGEV